MYVVERICNGLVFRIKKKMPEIDEERAEVINYGLQLIVGEIPKIFVIALIAYILRALELTILALLIMLPYRAFSGGVHLKTHIGCIIGTSIFYIGNAVLSKLIIFEFSYIKYLVMVGVWFFSMIMIKLYAPADTEAVPILRKKDRRMKKISSYITMTLGLVLAVFIKNTVICNIIIIGTFFQTIAITRFMYKITKNKYGYEEYYKNEKVKDLKMA